MVQKFQKFRKLLDFRNESHSTALCILQCYETNFYQIVQIVFTRSLKLIVIYIFLFYFFFFGQTRFSVALESNRNVLIIVSHKITVVMWWSCIEKSIKN